MSTKSITFRLIAYSEAAGKYNPDAPREGNEDNFYIDDDLSDDKSGNCQPDKIVTMSDCGCLMVVADGMGGMNAGEVASEIAIKTVEEHFAPGRITPKIANSKEERKNYLERVIKEADRNVKLDARNNPEHKGMGSTIILAWIVGDHATVSWCGDSRAYRFNPINGIEPLSRDHSYVQELVNRGEISYEATFDHPQNNIVTRSLGDPNNAAHPETRDFELYNGDIILVCSDGLSGVLRDKRTLLPDNSGNYYPGENLEDIIRGHQNSMIECKNALMKAAENADWYDNVTVLLCQILSGAPTAIRKATTKASEINVLPSPPNKLKKVMLYSAIAVLLILYGCGCFFIGKKCADMNVKGADQEDTEKICEAKGSDLEPGDSSEVGVKTIPGETKPTTNNEENSNTETQKYNKPSRNEWKEKSLKKIAPYKEESFTKEYGDLREQVKYVESAIENAQKGNDEQIKKNMNYCKVLISQISKRGEYLKLLKGIRDSVNGNDSNTTTYKKIEELLTSPLSQTQHNIITEDQFKAIQEFITKQKEGALELTRAH